MTAQKTLSAIGLSGPEEQLYLALLAHPGSPLGALTRWTRLSTASVRGKLKELERKGFVSRLATRPVKYMPAPPEMVIETHILKQKVELERARSTALNLSARFSSGNGNGHGEEQERLEVIRGKEAIDRHWRWLQQAAEREIVGFDRPPYVGSAYENPLQLETMARGVLYRFIYDRAAIDMEGRLPAIWQMLRAGEEARVYPTLPTKLFIADHRKALVVLTQSEPGNEQALITDSSRLLDVFTLLFETLWEQAIPFRPDVAPVSRSLGRDPLRPGHRDVLMMLAAGVKDERIARNLGIGVRTVQRRVKELMEMLGADTRFQMGMLAARHKWVEHPDPDDQ